MEVCCALVALLQLLVKGAVGARDTEEHLDTRENIFPEVYPATKIYGSTAGQCEGVTSTPFGKHALNQIRSEIREMANELAPVISRSRSLYGNCEFGHCEQNPVFSCAELKEINMESQSGLYWLQLSNGSSVRLYCDFDRQCSCSGTDDRSNSSEAWTRVAFYNMSDPSHDCPFNFKLNQAHQRRFCETKYEGCTSVFFDTLGITYGSVCGRVIGIQYGEPNAFRPYFRDPNRSLEDQYVDGISLTHGQAPRTHVWTFAMVEDETQSDDEACPCTVSGVFSGLIPPFIGNNYFCDTGSRTRSQYISYLDDPLWDGAGCGARSTCCEWQNPPWFCRSLPEPTQNKLEFRVCTDSPVHDEQLLIDIIEIYIQ